MWLSGGANDGSLLPLHVSVARRAETTPHAVAVVSPYMSLTYSELDSRATRLAHILHERVGTGNAFGILMGGGSDALAAILAGMKAGLVYVPLDISLPHKRLEAIVKESGISLALSSGDLSGFELSCEHIDLASVLAHRTPAVPIDSGTRLDDAASLIYTSGSTGTPQGVLGSHRSIASFCDARISTASLTGADRFMQLASFSWVAFYDAFPVLVAGGTVVFPPSPLPASPSAFFDLCRTASVTCFFAGPAFLQTLLHNEDEAMRFPSSLRLVMTGGEPVPRRLMERWLKETGGSDPRLMNVYGLTEGAGQSTYFILGDSLDDTWNSLPLGRPIPGVDLAVVDDELLPVEPGEVGELLVAGDTVALGYLRNPEQTARTFVPHPNGMGTTACRTGDYVKVTPDDLLLFVGRQDDQIQVHGRRVELGDIKAAIEAAPYVDCAEVVISRDSDSSAVVAFVVLKAGSDDVSEQTIRAFMEVSLPPFMIPRQIQFVDALPAGATGKVNRSLLAEWSFRQREIDAARDILMSAVRDVLSIQSADPMASFTSVGGDSILALEIALACSQQGLNIEVVELLDDRSLLDVSISAHNRSHEWIDNGGVLGGTSDSARDPFSESGIVEVVVSDDGAYSIWPAHRGLPSGWSPLGIRGSITDCMAELQSRWPDCPARRPLVSS